MSSRIKPDISQLIDQLEDETLREIFRRIIAFNEDEPQLQGFNFMEIQTTEAQANFKVRHNLGFIPKDLIRSGKIGSGNITFNRTLFDDQYLDVTTTGAVRWRGFVGHFLNDTSTIAETGGETI